jgi:hypothetical protein
MGAKRHLLDSRGNNRAELRMNANSDEPWINAASNGLRKLVHYLSLVSGRQRHGATYCALEALGKFLPVGMSEVDC